MNMKKDSDFDDELRPEYDLSAPKSRGRGVYAEAYAEGSNVVLLEADVQRAFPDSKSVNEALRLLIDVAHREVRS
jgi:hypothetical protein